MAYKHYSAGYLIKDGKVLLAHHKKFDKWVPPGGHIEENETPEQALIREWKEELGFDIDILPACESAYIGDVNTTPIPMPFYIDLECEGFDIPHVGYFFYVKLKDNDQKISISEIELHGVGWFSKEDLVALPTFEQVRALSNYAIGHYQK